MLDTTTQLNAVGPALAALPGVHAMTDVTGFGLLGHLNEICRGSKLAAEIDFAALPLLPAARTLAQQGVVTGASARNWASYGEGVRLPADWPEWKKSLLTDPQTSGGLLVACTRESAETVLARFHAAGFDAAAVIGRLHAGVPEIAVTQRSEAPVPA
jgi:selenide,water dikinase